MSEPERRKRKPYNLLTGSGKWKRLHLMHSNELTDEELSQYASHSTPSTSQARDDIQVDTQESHLETEITSEHSRPSCSEDELEEDISDTDIWKEPKKHFYSSSDDESSSSDNYNSCDEDEDCDNSPSQPEEISDVETLKIFLNEWARDKGVALSTLSALCVGLKNIHPSCFSALPSDGRTILKTPRNIDIKIVAPGKYIHIGLEKQIHFIISHLKSSNVVFSELWLLFNIDGLPLFKSSAGELYPILFSVPTIPELKDKVYPIGLYYGDKKPEDLELYLSPFLCELKLCLENGVSHDGSRINIKVMGFCCDAPAKSYILGVTSHTGYSSCTRCSVRGVTIENRRVFLETDCTPRTHEEFLNRTDLTHQPRTTPLVSVPGISFPKSFVLDYMHLICLGVMRTLLFIWCTGPLPLRLSKRQRDVISDYLLSCRNDMPVEFVRKPRELIYLKSWKATELRTFLLYLGPVILKEVLDEDRYLNFLSLHIATNILVSPERCSDVELINYAEELLLYFVSTIGSLYGDMYLTHNFHNLIHIVDDVRFFGPNIANFNIHSISAFQFENFLQSIKGMVRGRAKPLEQIGKRLGEEFSNMTVTRKDLDQSNRRPINNHQSLITKHNDGPLPAFCCNPQYRKVKFDMFELSTTHPNNICKLNSGKVVIIENIAYSTELKEQVIVGRECVGMENFYNKPCPSSRLGIFKVTKFSTRKRWPIQKIVAKCILIKVDERNISFTLAHC